MGTREVTAWNEKHDTYGHNVPKEYDNQPMPWPPPDQVPHEDIDTDDQRKQMNRERHSSYRK
jgi:hypothetical protein